MKKFLKNSITLSIIFVLVFAVFFSPKYSNAQVGVPISTTFDYQSVMNFQKNFTLDRIATLAAKQILHQITASVVNWINSGFEGSPAFLTNPGAFFLDAADQVTGAFLATNGPLSTLCSPFAIDIRLSLALSKTSMASQRYTCTLGKIIEAQKNGPDIIVNGQVVRSSQSSMNGFLRGDFNQGGWPAFIALTTEPQNNPYGAFLSAEGELNARINSRQATIRADLNLGQGFMSWQDCKDVPESMIDPSNGGIIGETDYADVRTKTKKDGTTVYQTCETKTPGSVISGTLQKNLNVPVTELELADDINAIVNALVSQMINTMLNKGLGALSGGGASGGTSYTQQIINDSYSGQEVQQTLDSLQQNVAYAIEQIDYAVPSYTLAIQTLTVAQNNLLSARYCISSKSSSDDADRKVADIDRLIATEITPLLGELNRKVADAASNRQKLNEISLALSGTGSSSNVQEQFRKYNELAQSGGLYVQQMVADATKKLSDAQAVGREMSTEAKFYQNTCNLIF